MSISTKTKVSLYASLLALALTTMTFAAKKDDKKAPAMDPAMMAKMQQMTAPGPNHQILQGLAGRWNVASKMWMKPGDKPEESTATSDNTIVYGGRYLKQEYTGMAMGQPFQGTGYYGYDNVAGEYQAVWLDSMSTGIMMSKGQYDAAAKTIKQSGTMSCPMTGRKDMAVRSEWKIVDNDHNVYSMYSPGPDGKEFKGMEIMFTRAK